MAARVGCSFELMEDECVFVCVLGCLMDSSVEDEDYPAPLKALHLLEVWCVVWGGYDSV